MINKMAVTIFLTLGISAGVLAAGGGGDDSRPSAKPTEYELALKAIKKENYRKAVSLLQTVTADDARNADAWNYLGYSLRHLKQFDDALLAYEMALKIKPKHKGALEYLGELYLQIGQLENAKAQLKRLDKACFFSCEEYRELKEKIEQYEAG